MGTRIPQAIFSENFSHPKSDTPKLDFSSTYKSLLLDGFYPKGWYLKQIDAICAMGLKRMTIRAKHWYEGFKPVVVGDVAEMDERMGNAIADEIERLRMKKQPLAIILPIGPMGM